MNFVKDSLENITTPQASRSHWVNCSYDAMMIRPSWQLQLSLPTAGREQTLGQDMG